MATNALTSTEGLGPYTAKRSFKDTPEPAPAERKDARGPLLFVIQQHSARRVHFDFRPSRRASQSRPAISTSR